MNDRVNTFNQPIWFICREKTYNFVALDPKEKVLVINAIYIPQISFIGASGFVKLNREKHDMVKWKHLLDMIMQRIKW